ncbi:MAG TPA: DUF2269 family protein [Candidatus Limnocylindrales bacterium]
MPFLLLKLVHVVAAIVAVGANVTYAFWLRRAGHDRERLTWAIRGIQALDSRLANPAYIVLLVTGAWMVLGGAFSFQTGWIVAALVLYVVLLIVGIFVYAPTIQRQLEEAEHDPSSPAYAAIERRSTLLGISTLIAVLAIVALMVTKPF